MQSRRKAYRRIGTLVTLQHGRLRILCRKIRLVSLKRVGKAGFFLYGLLIGRFAGHRALRELGGVVILIEIGNEKLYVCACEGGRGMGGCVCVFESR